MAAAPCLLFAQTKGDTAVVSMPAASALPDTLTPPGNDGIFPTLRDYGFEADGILPKKQSRDQYWDNVPADCHIDWRRHRKRPLIDFATDIAHLFSTYDTTYVDRNRFHFRAMALNTNYFQVYRVAGRDLTTGQRQLLTIAPDYAIKTGVRVGVPWLLVGFSRSVLPFTRKKSTEFNVTACNSRLGFDMNWQHSDGPFHLRRVRGIDKLPEYAVKGTIVDGINTNTYAATVYYVFNYRHFSYPAANSASTVQLRSAGSWLLGASYDYQHFRFDPAAAERSIQSVFYRLHPLEPLPTLMDQLWVSNVNYHRVGINIGYGYNWVPAPHWLVSASISPSIGFKKQVGEDMSKDMIVDNFRNFHVDAIFRASVNYNRHRWFAGASAVSYLYDYRHDDFDLNNSVTYIKVYVGLQFVKRRRYRTLADRTWW